MARHNWSDWTHHPPPPPMCICISFHILPHQIGAGGLSPRGRQGFAHLTELMLWHCWCHGDTGGWGIISSHWIGLDCQEIIIVWIYNAQTLRWHQNGSDAVSNHQPHHCLLSRLSRGRSKKTSKLRVTGLCAGNSPVTCEFPAQRASNAKNVPFDDVIMNLSSPWLLKAQSQSVYIMIQWNLSVTTTSIIQFITCDLFSNVF